MAPCHNSTSHICQELSDSSTQLPYQANYELTATSLHDHTQLALVTIHTQKNTTLIHKVLHPTQHAKNTCNMRPARLYQTPHAFQFQPQLPPKQHNSTTHLNKIIQVPLHTHHRGTKHISSSSCSLIIAEYYPTSQSGPRTLPSTYMSPRQEKSIYLPFQAHWNPT